MNNAQTITDLNAAYIAEMKDYIKQAEHMQLSPQLLLSYLLVVTDKYERNKERINGGN